MPTTIFNPGDKFERLTIVSRLPNNAQRQRRYLVRCDCGTEKSVLGHNLRSSTVNCGHHQRGIIRKHGDAGRENRPAEYTCWLAMKERCLNPNATGFEHYGGRGIKVCERWLNSYPNFLADMGRKPSPAHSIDRIDNDGNYEPSNCRWATQAQQVRNQRPRRSNLKFNLEAAA